MKTASPPHSYQTLHSPRGANAHFALGLHAAGGGFGLQADRVAQQNVFIGYRRGAVLHTLPFFAHAFSAELPTFLGEQSLESPYENRSFSVEAITRTLGWGSDAWQAPGIQFTLFSPTDGIPDPATTPPDDLKRHIAPALTARLTLDNRAGDTPVQGYFAVDQLTGLRPLAEETDGALCGWATSQGVGFACRSADYPAVRAVSQWELPLLFVKPNPLMLRLAPMGALLIDVAAGETATLDFVLGWYQPGTVTYGARACSYLYTRYFTGLGDLLTYSIGQMDAWRSEATAADQALSNTRLNAEQQFIIAQATRAYHASAMLLEDDGHPRYVVNEGSYMMMNTFDLAVDHIFYELRVHPWAVRNVLDTFADTYRYTDRVHFPGDHATLYPGGVAFTHDQGVYNTFSPTGYSAYEVPGQEGCYGYMTQEQLVNFILAAGLYLHSSRDEAWLRRRQQLLADCLTSMCNRDHPDPAQRDGVMDLDSSRTGGAAEITTYDSLDASLGQARRNLYLAVKSWAAYVVLNWVFEQAGAVSQAETARHSAELCAATLVNAFDPALGYIPALLDGTDRSPIIPAIEGLLFPYRMGLIDAVGNDGPYAALIQTLRAHLQTVLQPGVCRFPDGGWRLSARSKNSWISKIFLCQYVAREVLGIDSGRDVDRTHADWWRIGCASSPGIDQLFAGTNSAERFYYPRAVTSILWLDEGRSRDKGRRSPSLLI